MVYRAHGVRRAIRLDSFHDIVYAQWYSVHAISTSKRKTCLVYSCLLACSLAYLLTTYLLETERQAGIHIAERIELTPLRLGVAAHLVKKAMVGGAIVDGATVN